MENNTQIMVTIQTKNILPDTEQLIKTNIVEIKGDFKKQSPFCVDGRKGERTLNNNVLRGLYPQVLGGDLNATAVDWLLKGGTADFSENMKNVFKSLEENGFALGVHGGHHANEEKSDCGFADQMPAIINNLKNYSKEIFELLTNAAPDMFNKNEVKNLWEEIINTINDVDVKKIPSGKNLVDGAKSLDNIAFQNLEGEHEELAAVVNLKQGTTLDVDNNQDHQAFNLDLWYLEEQMKALKYSGEELEKAKLLTLGLYVATEMQLVEKNPKKGYRLPIIVNQ